MTSTLKINTIEPEGATTTLTVGESGQDTVIAGAGIKANVLKDAGANAIFTSNGSGVLSGVNSAFGSAQVLISTTTISVNSATVDITSGIDSTYKEYIFEFFNIIVDTSDKIFGFQINASGQTGFDETMTTTYFQAQHDEDDGYYTLNYVTGADQNQGTGYQNIFYGLNANTTSADECACGELHLYNPSSTTYVKNFYSRFINVNAGNSNDPGASDTYAAGYINTTSAITEISFKQSSGDIEGGTIKMYGIK